MSRTLLCMTASLAALGCQNLARDNPYAAFGPATVPAAPMQTTPQPGYYQPPAATPTLSSTLPPIVTPPAAGSRPSLSGGTIRSEISATPAAASPIISTPSPATSSFSTTATSAGEAAIRIVEAAPATAGRGSNPTSSKPTFSAAIAEPKTPAVVAAHPKSGGAAALKTIPAPGVPFNPSTTSPLSPAATPPASLDRTRGFSSPLPPNSTPVVPKNRVMSVPSIRRDTSVSPATYVETASDATGQWKAR